MAHRVFVNIAKKMPVRSMLEAPTPTQRFKNLLIMDFEATCDKINIPEPQEIIEFPCMVLSTEDWKVKDVFHEYVKPRYNEISPFCTDLTGIMQETVENQSHFPEIFARFCDWLEDGQYFKDEPYNSAFITCGDWDLRIMLQKQCQLDNISLPKYFEDWIDLKKTFCEATQYFPRGMKHMAAKLLLDLTGRAHSGIDDCHNTGRIICKLHQWHSVNYQLNSSIHKKPCLGVKMDGLKLCK